MRNRCDRRSVADESPSSQPSMRSSCRLVSRETGPQGVPLPAGFETLAISWHCWGVLDSLDRVVLAVPELDVAVRQYVRLLGRTPSWHGEHPASGTQNSLFRVDNTVIEIVAPMGEGAEGLPSENTLSRSLRSWLDAHGEGLLGLVFGTDDADALRSLFAQRGLQPTAVEKEIDRDVESGAFREWRRFSLSPGAARGVSLSAVEAVSPEEVIPPGAALGEEDASVFALDHAVVQTRDADAARSLYGDGLGLRLALEREFPQWGSRLLFFRVGGVTIEVAASLGEGQGDGGIAADAPADRDRLWGLCWRVRDAVAARGRMEDAGFDVSPLRDGRKPGTRVFSLRGGTCGVPTLVLEPPGR